MKSIASNAAVLESTETATGAGNAGTASAAPEAAGLADTDALMAAAPDEAAPLDAGLGDADVAAGLLAAAGLNAATLAGAGGALLAGAVPPPPHAAKVSVIAAVRSVANFGWAGIRRDVIDFNS